MYRSSQLRVIACPLFGHTALRLTAMAALAELFADLAQGRAQGDIDRIVALWPSDIRAPGAAIAGAGRATHDARRTVLQISTA